MCIVLCRLLYMMDLGQNGEVGKTLQLRLALEQESTHQAHLLGPLRWNWKSLHRAMVDCHVSHSQLTNA